MIDLEKILEGRSEAATLQDMARELNALLDMKDRNAQEAKDIGKAIDKTKERMRDQFLDDDCDEIAIGGYTFKPTPKTAYSKRSEEALSEAGLVFFDVLREHGLGDIIVPTVNARTLQSTITAYVAEHGELDGTLAQAISAYDYIDIARRKITTRKGGKK